MSDSDSRENDESMSDFRPTSGAPSLDTLFDVLANRRRRTALRCLVKYETSVTLADLADEVAVQEHGTPITDISAEEVMQVYLSLYHAHIPKLVDAGIAEYSQEQDLVKLSEETERVERLLDAAPTEE